MGDAELPSYLGGTWLRTDVPGVAKADRIREKGRGGPDSDTRFGISGGTIEPPPSFSMGEGRSSPLRPGSRASSPTEKMRPYYQVASSSEDEEEAQ